jgi:catechol 2,3-dioxygenase-like lactoylglutathione lyase family enzyme
LKKRSGMTTFSMAMLVCKDIERSRNFYRDVLGLRVGTEAIPHWVDFDLGDGAKLGLYAASGYMMVRPGSLELAFHVPNVDVFIAEARMSGASILQEPFDDRFLRVAVIADPDGYAVRVGTPKQ